jgi:hypothetical protein
VPATGWVGSGRRRLGGRDRRHPLPRLDEGFWLYLDP